MAELKSCPFCGGRAYIQYWDYPSGDGMEARVVCSGCHVSTSRVYQSGRTTYILTGEDINKPLVIEKALASWNRRAGIESSGGEGADMVATNDECRRAAAALRGCLDGKECWGNWWKMLLESVAEAVGMTADDNPTAQDFCNRLADLIDPGESARDRDAAPMEPDGCWIFPSSSREALLALADEMDAWANDGGDGFKPVLSRAGCAAYARRIREALGWEGEDGR